MPLSPKWATPGLGSDFAISPYLFDPCDSDTDAIVTNPHTDNALSTTARRTPPTQSARRRELLPPSWTHAPVGYVTISCDMGPCAVTVTCAPMLSYR